MPRERVVLTNTLSDPTTVHWHGVEVPNAMDGVPGITQLDLELYAPLIIEPAQIG